MKGWGSKKETHIKFLRFEGVESMSAAEGFFHGSSFGLTLYCRIPCKLGGKPEPFELAFTVERKHESHLYEFLLILLNNKEIKDKLRAVPEINPKWDSSWFAFVRYILFLLWTPFVITLTLLQCLSSDKEYILWLERLPVRLLAEKLGFTPTGFECEDVSEANFNLLSDAFKIAGGLNKIMQEAGLTHEDFSKKHETIEDEVNHLQDLLNRGPEGANPRIIPLEMGESDLPKGGYKQSKRYAHWQQMYQTAGDDRSAWFFHALAFCGFVTFICSIIFQAIANFNDAGVNVMCYVGLVFYVMLIIRNYLLWTGRLRMNKFELRCFTLVVPFYAFPCFLTLETLLSCHAGTAYSTDDGLRDINCSVPSYILLYFMTIFGMMSFVITILNDILDGNDLTIIVVVLGFSVRIVAAFAYLFLFLAALLVIGFDSITCNVFVIQQKLEPPKLGFDRTALKGLRNVVFFWKSRSETDCYLYDSVENESGRDRITPKVSTSSSFQEAVNGIR